MAVKSTPVPSGDPMDSLPTAVAFEEMLLILLAVAAAVLFAINLMPTWLPSLQASTTGDKPQVFWFISRGTAIASYWVLWLSMGSGVLITNKMAQKWPGIPPAYEIHQYTSLLGLALGLFHALILMGDHYIHYNLFQVLAPFASENYRPFWVGLGQLAFYLWAAVNVSFYIRKRIGKKAWRAIHFASFVSFAGVLVHGIFSGTDISTQWMQGIYWASGAVLLFLVVYRVLNAKIALTAK